MNDKMIKTIYAMIDITENKIKNKVMSNEKEIELKGFIQGLEYSLAIIEAFSEIDSWKSLKRNKL